MQCVLCLAIRKKLQEKVGVGDISLTYSMNCEHSTKKEDYGRSLFMIIQAKYLLSSQAGGICGK